MPPKKGKSRQHWNKVDWDSAFSTSPTVVNATLNSFTNEFEVTQPKPTRSNFDFSSPDHSQTWIYNDQQGWNTAPTNALNEWSTETFDENVNQDVHPGRFSTKDTSTATFRLNMEIEDDPVFTKVVDYTSFRTQTIIPEYDDILIADELKDPEEWENRHYRDPLPGIPINHVKSPYDSTDQYLYTHFELMRQDFLIPLQKAVKAYKETLNSIKSDDVGEAMEILSFQKPFRLYEHVHLNAIVFGNRHPLYRISFRLPYYVRVDWTQSKRLMPGSLVLLSKDNFEKDLKIATIIERGDKPMRGPNRFEYMVDLYLERDNEFEPLGFGDPSLSNDDTYVMLEATDGYFEAYRHVLNVFQKIDPDNLPFSHYLVKLSNNVLVPHYAARKRIYDINPQPNSRNKERWTVDIMEDWPIYKMGMDKTQLDALKTILSNNLSIVQGPPGTGKTFVGTYAMRVLLNNFSQSLGPIICICQTNHALDQFLEHILDHCDSIVRVGGRSKSERLKERTLYELKKVHERPRGIGRLYRNRDNIAKDIRETIIELYEEPCVTIEFISSIKALRPRQIESLKRMSEREKDRIIPSNLLGSFDIDDNDSDDDWEISSDIPTTSARNNKKPTVTSKDKKVKKSAYNDWAGGNPNLDNELKKKSPNPVEIWLREAIDYVDDNGEMSTVSDEIKQNFLEQEKGLVFTDIIDERELIEKDELEDVIGGFRGDDIDMKENKNPFIQIGRSYKRQTEPELGERPERKIVNYKKMKTTHVLHTQQFNFFEDSIDELTLEEENTKYSLERWMKEDDLSMWPLPVRLKAHKKWIDQRNAILEDKLNSMMKQYHHISTEIRKVMANFEAKICRENRVVGMTSTAAAKYHDLLEEIRPRVMVVEEAAEMLESHIISALTDSLEHLILIGDHQQLRPSTAVHELSDNHALGVSLFERLVINQFPFTRLSHQRRMRPEIRSLIDPIYKNPPLNDHPNVLTFPPIRGMEQSVFFLAHEEEETCMRDSASKMNEHEAKLTAKLSTYLLLQGYSTDEITIITMYSGQKQMIKKALRDERRPDIDPELINISSVDGYQGEENKIIILSLVRSNSIGQIGFLKVANRVCVALSRAQHGMYILGNARLLCEKSDLWNEIVGNLEDRNENMIGTKLTLRCSKHNEKTEIKWPVDFTEVSEGGCRKMCNEILPCGHKCTLKCHPYDHSDYRCKQICEKILDCKHSCMRRCSEPCSPCIKRISVRLPCGHTIDWECGEIRRLVLAPQGQTCPVCKAPLSTK
ncbi:RNA helicase [Cokeromyces recurvatus]|uniref:RNA helicase n=1 Tax=Cokeromyces recurvatus TaxID=90255 RepID=UPI0022208856|nr:RNA helicase [Cokeromyces recurvatus]KAI7906448.1 RNA helicase [Cokeromyces recurvatus]